VHTVQPWLVVGGVGLCLGVGGTLHAAVGAGHVEAGAMLSHERCSPCHGMDGKATTPMAQAMAPKPRDHTDGAYMNQLSDTHIATVIKKGGTAVGKSSLMPAQPALSAQQLADLVAFVRTLAVPPYHPQ
jgi:cytochrome c551/c552